MNKFLIVIVVCVLLNSCKPGIPKDIIQPNQMEKVLFDIHVVDGFASGLNLPNQDSAKKIISPLYKGVYKKHGIDSALLSQSLNYYYKHPDLLTVMYEHITKKLSKSKEKAETMQIRVKKITNIDTSKKLKLALKPKDTIGIKAGSKKVN
jgi:hypothetical protein